MSPAAQKEPQVLRATQAAPASASTPEGDCAGCEVQGHLGTPRGWSVRVPRGLVPHRLARPRPPSPPGPHRVPFPLGPEHLRF